MKPTSSNPQLEATPSHRAQILWSFFVAVAVALVVLHQARGSRTHTVTELNRSESNQLRAPETLVTGVPVPLRSLASDEEDEE